MSVLIWVICGLHLGLAIVLMKGWPTLIAYITNLSPAEPVFVVVIMAMASSLPVLRFAETLLAKVAAFGHSTAAAWYPTFHRRSSTPSWLERLAGDV